MKAVDGIVILSIYQNHNELKTGVIMHLVMPSFFFLLTISPGLFIFSFGFALRRIICPFRQVDWGAKKG